MDTAILRDRSDTVVNLYGHTGCAPGRMGRRALAALLIGLVLIGPQIALGFSLPAAAGPDGAARPWEAGQPVGPMSLNDERVRELASGGPSAAVNSRSAPAPEDSTRP